MSTMTEQEHEIIAYPAHTVYRDGTTYCPISQRTEGTRWMRGEICSYCAEPTGVPFARKVWR